MPRGSVPVAGRLCSRTPPRPCNSASWGLRANPDLAGGSEDTEVRDTPRSITHQLPIFSQPLSLISLSPLSPSLSIKASRGSGSVYKRRVGLVRKVPIIFWKRTPLGLEEGKLCYLSFLLLSQEENEEQVWRYNLGKEMRRGASVFLRQM